MVDRPPVASPPSGRRAVLIAAIVFAVVGIVALVAFLVGRGDGFPAEVLGYERLRGGQGAAAEDVMENIEIGDLEITAAVYGEADTPRLVAVLYGNYPSNVDIHTIVRGMTQGMEACGGSVDEASLEVAAGDGHELACVEAGGPGFLVPNGRSEDGVACVFHGETTGLVLTTHSSIANRGLQDVRAFLDAYLAA